MLGLDKRPIFDVLQKYWIGRTISKENFGKYKKLSLVYVKSQHLYKMYCTNHTYEEKTKQLYSIEIYKLTKGDRSSSCL